MYWMVFIMSFYGGLGVAHTEINYDLEGTDYNNYRAILDLVDVGHNESLPNSFYSYGVYGGIKFNENVVELSYYRSDSIRAVFQIPSVGMGYAEGRLETIGVTFHTDRFSNYYGNVKTNAYVGANYHNLQYRTKWNALIYSDSGGGSKHGWSPVLGLQASIGKTNLRVQREGNWFSEVDSAVSIQLRTEF